MLGSVVIVTFYAEIATSFLPAERIVVIEPCEKLGPPHRLLQETMRHRRC